MGLNPKYCLEIVFFSLHGLHYQEKFKKEREDLIEAKKKEKEDKEKKREEMKRILEEEKQRRKELKEQMKIEKERVSWKKRSDLISNPAFWSYIHCLNIILVNAYLFVICH